MTSEQAYYVPLHHQMRPWAMKKEVTTVHLARTTGPRRDSRIQSNPPEAPLALSTSSQSSGGSPGIGVCAGRP